MAKRKPRSSCLKCGAALKKPPTGRPPTYCGEGCRRSSEYELRRLLRLLERLDRLRIERRVAIASTSFLGPESKDDVLRVLKAEIARGEARLHELADAERAEP